MPALVLACMVLLGLSSEAWGANHYVRAAATGTASGADWTNATTDLPGTLVRGDTYYVAAGSYAQRLFGDTESGALLITVKAATAADHGTDTGWSNNYIGQASWSSSSFHVWAFTTGYYTFDGVYGSGPGTSAYGFRLDKSPTTVTGCGSTAGSGIQIQSGVTNLTFRFVEIKGTGNVAADPNNVFDWGLLVADGANNLSLAHLWVHDQGGGWMIVDGVATLLLETSWFRNMHSTPACHAEGLALRTPSATGNTNLTVRYNSFENADGTAYIATPIGNINGPANSNWYFYGNVFFYNGAESNGQAKANGIFQIFTTLITGDFSFFNNTISTLDTADTGNCGILFTGTSSNTRVDLLTVQNNVWHSCVRAPGIPAAGANGLQALVWDHNSYFDSPTSGSGAPSEQNAAGNPFADVAQTAGHTNFHLATATLIGTSLAATYAVDVDGRGRGLDGLWDRGAYEYVAGPPPALQRLAPVRRRQ